MVNNKHLKQKLQHSHNQNWLTYTKVLRKLGLFEIYQLLPKEAREFIYNARFSSVRIESSPGDHFGRGVIEAAQKDFHHLLCTETLEIPGTGKQFTLHEILVNVYSCLLSTCHFFNDFTRKPLGGKWTKPHEAWIDKVATFSTWVYAFNDDSDSPIKKILNQLSNQVCMCDRGYYWFARRHKTPIYGNTLVRIYQLHHQEPQTERVALDGKIRTVYRLAIARTSEPIKWISISGETLGLQPSREYPVYLQMHALDRARERLAPLRNTSIGQLLVDACIEPEIVYSNNFYQMTVRLDGCKVGYLLFTLCEGMLVGRTFLFLTQSGCPEGQAINERFGIGKYEKEYLKIDRLAIFLQSDILYDKSIAAMLTACGCADLVKLQKHVVPEKNYAAHLRKTLCLDEYGCEEESVENVSVAMEMVR
jgi:hypothetical protein